jgi:Tfp pilus assembly protein FimT
LQYVQKRPLRVRVFEVGRLSIAEFMIATAIVAVLVATVVPSLVSHAQSAPAGNAAQQLRQLVPPPAP